MWGIAAFLAVAPCCGEEANELAMVKAWVVGICVLVAALLVWAVLLELETYSQSMAIILWLSPGAAAFVTAYLAPSHRFLLGTSMGISAALLQVAFNAAWQLQGHAVDFPGVAGAGILFTLTLAYATVLASLGALVGYYLTRNSG